MRTKVRIVIRFSEEEESEESEEEEESVFLLNAVFPCKETMKAGSGRIPLLLSSSSSFFFFFFFFMWWYSTVIDEVVESRGYDPTKSSVFSLL